MAKQTRGGFPNVFADFSSANNFRKQAIDGPADAAVEPAIATLLEVAGLLTILPQASIASQERELARLKATRGDGDPRVVQLESSLARAATLRELAGRGQVRFARAAAAVADGEDVFHGFVSDGELNPVANLTVRVSGTQLSATTANDGYFRIPLGTKRGGLRGLFSGRASVKDAKAEAVATDGEPAIVEVLQKNNILHTDPVPLPLDRGRVYREYIVSTEAPARPNVKETLAARRARKK